MVPKMGEGSGCHTLLVVLLGHIQMGPCGTVSHDIAKTPRYGERQSSTEQPSVADE